MSCFLRNKCKQTPNYYVKKGRQFVLNLPAYETRIVAGVWKIIFKTAIEERFVSKEENI